MEDYPDYFIANTTYDFFDYPRGLDGHALFQCIAVVLMTILFLFLTSAIILDRKRYEKTFLMVILNFAVSGALMCFMKYFGEVHIMVFTTKNKSACHVTHFLNFVMADASNMAVLPIFVDTIVKYLRPERYEKRKYGIFTLILILLIWLTVIIKEIIYRSQSIIEFNCLESKPISIMWIESVLVMFRALINIVAIGFLLFIVITKRPLSEVLGFVLAPLLLAIFTCITELLTATHQYNALTDDNPRTGVPASILYFQFLSPIIFALIWLAHSDVRVSLKQLATCAPCRKSGPQASEHELTSDMA